jgi:hypothetical protein
MKANELRIGNWVEYELYGVKNIQQIEHTDFEFISDNELRCAKPIPLTEELLVKLWFEKSSDNNYYKGGTFTIYNRFGNFGLIGGSLSWKEFKYLHQLQNLYFALTGEELTLNP